MPIPAVEENDRRKESMVEPVVIKKIEKIIGRKYIWVIFVQT
jgi:hypothetical protein